MVSVEKRDFGSAHKTSVALYCIRSPGGLEADITTWGAAVVSVRVPNRDGVVEEVTLNHRTLPGIRGQDAYYGATIGRVASTIAGARYRLGGKEHTVSANVNGVHHAHGGFQGFDKQVWAAEVVPGAADSSSAAVRFTYISIDGEEGYGGCLTASVTYIVTVQNHLIIEYRATTDKPTPINLTNHTYWNLSGECQDTIHRHTLRVHASRMQKSPVDSSHLVDVETDTPYDFREPRVIGKMIKAAGVNGYDHVFVLDAINRPEPEPEAKLAAGEPDLASTSSMCGDQVGSPLFGSQQMREAAVLMDGESGRVMSVTTNQPCLIVYTANHLPHAKRKPPQLPPSGGKGVVAEEVGDKARRDGRQLEPELTHRRHGAVCLEAVNFIGSLRFNALPTMVLQPGHTYHHRTVHHFTTIDTAHVDHSDGMGESANGVKPHSQSDVDVARDDGAFQLPLSSRVKGTCAGAAEVASL